MLNWLTVFFAPSTVLRLLEEAFELIAALSDHPELGERAAQFRDDIDGLLGPKL